MGPLVAHISARTYTAIVSMKGNGISELHAEAFTGTEQSVSRVDFSSNQLTRVDFSIFNAYTQLQVCLQLTELIIPSIS